MRGLLTGVLGLFISLTSHAQETTFVERCLDSTPVLKSKLRCILKDDFDQIVQEFTLNKGITMTVKSTAKGNSFNAALPVWKIQHLPPRLTDLGAMDESVKFMAAQGSTSASMTIPCGQSDYAVVGASAIKGIASPDEYVAECFVE